MYLFAAKFLWLEEEIEARDYCVLIYMYVLCSHNFPKAVYNINNTHHPPPLHFFIYFIVLYITDFLNSKTKIYEHESDS